MQKKNSVSMKDGKFSTTIKPVTFEKSLRAQLKEAETVAEKNKVYDQVILCNEFPLVSLCCDLVRDRFGFMNDDCFDDLYQEGMLFMTETLHNRRQNPNFKWCTPKNLMYGMERYLRGKLRELS